MTKRRQWRCNLSAMGVEKRQAVKYPAKRFPIQHEIKKLEDELDAFNERIEELENEGHRSHAMGVEGKCTRFCTSNRRVALRVSGVRSLEDYKKLNHR